MVLNQTTEAFNFVNLQFRFQGVFSFARTELSAEPFVVGVNFRMQDKNGRLTVSRRVTRSITNSSVASLSSLGDTSDVELPEVEVARKRRRKTEASKDESPKKRGKTNGSTVSSILSLI
jgi:hypothetical protein